MSMLQLAVPLVVMAIFAFIPAIFLRVGAKLVAKQTVSQNLAYVLTLACYLPTVAAMIAVSQFVERTVAISAAVMSAGLLLLPAFLYGRFIKSVEGRAIGFVMGLGIALVQHIVLGLAVFAIAVSVEYLRHS